MTPAGVTARRSSSDHDPNAAALAGIVTSRDPGNPRTSGPSCVQLAGNQNPPPESPERPGDGIAESLDGRLPPTPIPRSPAIARAIDLTDSRTSSWVTRIRVSRRAPVVKLADGNWFVGDYAERAVRELDVIPRSGLAASVRGRRSTSPTS